MRLLFVLTLLAIGLKAESRLLPKPQFSGMYAQWGYNRDVFSKSDLHFSGRTYDFTIHGARAVDGPDFDAFSEMPLDITIPQNSCRVGVYLNAGNTWAIEINFDHAKYVVNDNQTLRVSGMINGERIDKDTIIRRQFVHFEHSNGANFWHLNYVHQKYLVEGKKYGKLSYLIKGGAGIVFPRSDVTLMNKRLDNKYHIAGYIISSEVGMRWYPLRNFFLELNGKAGFANYLNVLTVDDASARHHFWYAETIFLAGYDLNFGHRRVRPERNIPLRPIN